MASDYPRANPKVIAPSASAPYLKTQRHFSPDHPSRAREVACIRCEGGITLGYRYVMADPEGRYRIVKEIIADPHQPCVLIHARVEAETEWFDRLQLYALLAPHLEGGGWGNSARRMTVNGQKLLVAWSDAAPVQIARPYRRRRLALSDQPQPAARA